MKNSDNVNNNSNNFSSKLADLIKENISINPEHYEIYNVKRGLRNSDGTGVLVGLTVIGEVHSYILDENEKVDIPGKLWYRGIDIEDIVSGCVKENRLGFEEVIFLSCSVFCLQANAQPVFGILKWPQKSPE